MPEVASGYVGLLLIADGLGDRPVPELDGQTPLEAANIPTLDRLAREGECGLLDPVAPGVRGGSDTSHLSLLGYDPYQVYPGRGPFEAMGIGLEVQPGDVAFRANFATVDGPMKTILDRRAGRSDLGTRELAAAVDGVQIEDVICRFKESTVHRAALVLHGPGLGDQVTDPDPHENGLPLLEARPRNPQDAASAKTARIVNAFLRLAFERWQHHPVNERRRALGIPVANLPLPRGPGRSPHLEPFQQKWGLSAACIVEVGLVKGLGRYLGMEVIEVPGSTAGLDTDTQAIGGAVIEAAGRHPFVLCNVKGPDVAAHDHNAPGKVAIIEKIDAMAAQIVTALGDRLILAVTGDHTTACTYGDHTGEPCPILFWGPTVRTDSVQRFGERPCAAGAVGRIRGTDVLRIMTSYMNVQEKFGA
ncbi:MAG: 2,3-bisphosphoglycerate-independent phosphoglycerate mutase [Armatimonadetes bacterium]|nr:2,3-bisphosphoglycerate-independent phosphoglycerate mutase [Armatimonadota bacterium]